MSYQEVAEQSAVYAQAIMDRDRQCAKLANALNDCIGSLQAASSWIKHDEGGKLARDVVQAEIKRYRATLAEWKERP